MKNRFILLLLGALVLLATIVVANAAATGGEPHKAFVCKYVGTPGVDETLQTGQNPISVDFASLEGIPAIGQFFSDAQGRSVVIAIDTGQPEPSVSECPPPSGPPPPPDVCPNLPGDQATVPEGYHLGEDENGRPVCIQDEVEVTPLATGASFTEATCETAPSVQLTKTNIVGLGLRPFYNVEGPDFVDGHPVAGGTYTFTAISIVGYVLTGGISFTHTFAAARTDCGTPPPPPPPGTPVGNATVICLMPAAIYQLSGTVDGQTADSVTPATLPGGTKGVTNVVVTRGDTSVRTTVATNGDCVPPTVPGTTATPAAVTTPVTTPPPAAKPVVKPKPKPVRKPAAKPKPKPKPKPKAPKKAPKKAPQHPPHTLGL